MGSQMLHVDFKECMFPCQYYFCNLHDDFKMVLCRMSILRNTIGRVVYFHLLSDWRMSILRNGHVTVSNLGVKSPKSRSS